MNNRDINVELKDEIININLPFADRGLPGKSAYELAVEAGFIGTEEEWRASLKGDTGETPDIEIGTVVTGSTSSVTRRGTDENPIFDFVLEKGDTGPQGETGATGPQGQTGLTPNIQIGTVSSGDAPAVTRTGSDEEPIFNFVLEKGPKPVKGVDYYTEQDKEEIINDVTGDALSIFNQNAAQKTDNFNYNATSKTNEFNTNATTKTSEYNTNASNKLSAYDTNASDKLDTYNDNHTSKLTAYNENASIKLTEFNTNATTKTTDFNDNASLKTTEFNTNAQNKTDEFNENKEALQKELDEVYEELDRYKMLENALPKVNGEGTEVTLNDTANAPMKMSLGASELEQDETPTPETPQEIHTISGDNKIVVGNLINLLDWNKFIDFSNWSDALSQGYKKFQISGLKPNTIYTLCRIDNTGYNKGIYTGFNSARNNTNIFISSSDTTKNLKYISATSTGTGELYIVSSGISSQNDLNYLVNTIIKDAWVIQGDTFIERQEQTLPLNLGDLEYCKIGDYEDEFVIPDKNLFNSESWYNALSNIDNTAITKEVVNNIEYYKFRASNATIRNYEFMSGKFKQNTQYTISIKALRYNNTSTSTGFRLVYEDDTYDAIYVNSTTETNFVLTSKVDKTLKYIGLSYADSNYVLVRDIMLNEGTTALPYEPFNDGKWYLKKNIYKLIFDSEHLAEALYPSYNGVYFIASNQMPQIETRAIGISNRSNRVGDYWSGNTIWVGVNTKVVYWLNVMTELGFTTIEQFNEWLSNNLLVIYYIMTTPQYILLNDTLQTQLNNIQKVLAYQDQTNISQVNNDLPFRLKLSAIRDMSNIFELIENNSSTSSTLSSPLSTPNLVSSTSIIEPDVSTTDVVNNTSEI